jgi:hypothetical protein
MTSSKWLSSRRVYLLERRLLVNVEVPKSWRNWPIVENTSDLLMPRHAGAICHALLGQLLIRLPRRTPRGVTRYSEKWCQPLSVWRRIVG